MKGAKPRTRYKTRTRVDMSRVAVGMKMAGIDTRNWFALARVDEDPDATVWDEELGWLVDVTIVGGPLDGDGPVLCRMASSGASSGKGRYDPPHQGCLVIVAIPAGDTNSECIIVGQLHDSDCKPPSEVNGTAITEDFATRTHVLAFPGEDFDAQFDNVRITGQMVLGAAAADQPFPRGNDLADALDSLVDALSMFLDQAVAPPGPFGSVAAAAFTAAGATLKLAVQQFKLSRQTYLSTTIKGT